MNKMLHFFAKYAFLLTVLFSVSILSSKAQNLEERIKKLESTSFKLPTINGLVNGRFQYVDKYNDADRTNSFDIRRARLDVRGNLSSALDYRIQVEFASSPKVLDAFFRWKLSKYFNIQTGQFKIPFTLENPYSPTTLETIENSTVISKLSGYSDVVADIVKDEALTNKEPNIKYLSTSKANGRDIGLAAYGGFIPRNGFDLINYYLGIFNGNGINVKADDNKNKDFAGILIVNPFKTLAIAASHYNGSINSINKETKDTTDYIRTYTSIGAKYDDKKLLVRGEYLFGKTAGVKHDGFYVTTGYFVTPEVQPVLKYDFYRPDTDNEDKNQTRYIAGVNVYPVKNLRLQANYTYKIEANKDENIVALQALVSF